MSRRLRFIGFTIIICCLMIALGQTALAAETFQTTDHVRLRTSPSTDADVVSVINPGTNVEVLEHDPAGWSKVRVNGTIGFIRSDLLKFPIGNTPATFKATEVVRFRSGPSTDDQVIRTLSTGASVEVLEHDPAGWSKVRVSDSIGYIRSDFLARPISGSQQTSSSPAAAQSNVRVIIIAADGVNFREGPSTDSNVIRTLSSGTSVGIMEQYADGWSKVSVNGTVGYIKSELLRPSGRNVELLEWSTAKNVVRTGVPITVVDVRTGITFTIKCFSKSGHADVEPATSADTEAILRTRGGVWAWAPRPVWVTIGDRTIAAALNGMPHAGSTISGNGMNGHLCLHFSGTVANSKSYERDLNNAVMEAWNAAQ